MNTRFLQQPILWLTFSITLLVVVGCSSSGEQQPASKGSPDGAPTTTTLLRFSKAPTVTGSRTAGNWCYRYYPEAVLLSALPDNVNSRFFDAPPGVYKIFVRYGKLTASTLLRSFGSARAVEVFTSDHFPECLSNAANFRLQQDGAILRYDNGENIHFNMSAQPNGDRMRIHIELPVGADYGVEVRLCDNCED